MNAADRKEFDLIHEKIDNIKDDIKDMKHDMSMAHGKTEESLRFMKENKTSYLLTFTIIQRTLYLT